MSDRSFRVNPELLLVAIFKEADRAGWGMADGATFEAFPGCEDAAADYIQFLIGGEQ